MDSNKYNGATLDNSVQKKAISEVEEGEILEGEVEEGYQDDFGVSNKQARPFTVLAKRPLAKSKISDSDASIKTKLVSQESEQDDGFFPFFQRLKNPAKSVGCQSSVDEGKEFKELGNGSEYSIFSAELDSNEKEPAFVPSSTVEYQMKSQVEEKRLHSLERDIEERSKELEEKKKQFDSVQGQLRSCSLDVKMRKREHEAIRRSIEQRSREFEAQGEQLRSMRKLIYECERHLRLKEEQCMREIEMAQEVIGKREEVREKMKREVEEHNGYLEEKEDLIRERERELKTQQIELHQVIDNIDIERERKEEELKALLNKIAECTKELQTKEKKLDAMQKLVDEQAEQLQSERNKFLKVMSIRINRQGEVKEFDSMKERFEGQIRELELKYKQFAAQMEELALKEKHIEGRAKEIESKEKLFEGRVEKLKSKERQLKERAKELASKEKEVEGQAKELQHKEKQFEVQLKKHKPKQQQFEGEVKDLESIKNQFEGRLKEFEFEKKQYGALKESFYEEEVQDSQSSPCVDGTSLQFFSNEQTNEELLGNEVLAYLQSSSDPANLILDIMKDPFIPQCEKGDKVLTIDDSHIFMLEQLMRISPRINPHVKEEAMKLALELKANTRASAENSLEVLAFLLILSIYGLVSSFNEDEVLKLFGIAARHKQAVELFQVLGFEEKISDFVESLIMKQQHVEAVRFICAYNLTQKTQPIDLLGEHVRKTKLLCESSCNKTKSIGIKVMAIDEEIACLGTVLKCISDNNLECQDLVQEIQDHILEQEEHKANMVETLQVLQKHGSQ